MLALYIICGIALLIVFLLFSSVSLTLNIDSDAQVKIGYLFFSFKILPKKVHRSKKGEIKPKQDSEKKSLIQKMIDEKGIVSTVKELIFISKTVIRKSIAAARHIRVKRLKFVVTVASEDPMKTALEYGSLCSIVFPALSGFKCLMKFNDNKTNVLVLSDFDSDKPSCYLDCKLKLRLYFIIKAAFGVLWQFLKRNISNNSKNNSVKKTAKAVKK